MKPIEVFIIQPFESTHSTRFKELVIQTCTELDGRFHAFRADEEQSHAGPRLQDRIDSYIKKANICIADLSGTTNHNVLLEVGAAYTLNIPVIPISNQDLPTDIKGNLRIQLDPATIDKEDTEKLFKSTLRQRLLEAESEIGNTHGPQFIAYGYEARHHIDFHRLVRGSERRIDVLTTNLGFFVNYEFTVKHNGQEKLSILDMLGQTLAEKPDDFSIRVLVLDPDSNFTNDRATGLGRDRREFRELLRQDLKTLVEFVGSPECVRAFQIKTYEALPTQVTYTFDDVLVSSVVATDRSSRECIHYVHSVSPRGVIETFGRQFDYFWARGTSVASKQAPHRRRHHSDA